MTDLWSFLLQSLTASAAAALLLLLKALFRDKLPPSWHFAIWGVLGLVILVPAGLFGATYRDSPSFASSMPQNLTPAASAGLP